jgi:protein transport protein SEC13
VWKEHSPHQWVLIHKFLGHEGSVNSIAWAPRQYGLRLACASSDEHVSILAHSGGGQWSSTMLKAHKTGVNAVNWAPSAEGGEDPMRLVTGGCDNLVRIWQYDSRTEGWVEADVLPSAHADWVRDVAWAPAVAGGSEMIASCSQDKRVIIWTRSGGEWRAKAIQVGCIVWSVSWSVTGSILAAAGGDNQVCSHRRPLPARSCG